MKENKPLKLTETLKNTGLNKALLDFSMLLQATGSELESPYLEKGEDSKGRELSIKTFHLCFHRSS